MQVNTPLCGILIFHARQLADCACWRAVHLRGVNTFRSIETEFANIVFSFRDSDSPSVSAKGSHGGKRPGSGRKPKHRPFAEVAAERRSLHAEAQARHMDASALLQGT